MNQCLGPIFFFYFINRDCVNFLRGFFFQCYAYPLTANWNGHILFCPQCQSSCKICQRVTILLALLEMCCNLIVSSLFKIWRVCVWYETKSFFLTSYSLRRWLMTNCELPYTSKSLMPLSKAIWRPKISAWHSDVLLEHNWVNANEYGRMCFLGGDKNYSRSNAFLSYRTIKVYFPWGKNVFDKQFFTRKVII